MHDSTAISIYRSWYSYYIK